MTAIVRDIGSIPVADLQANTIDWGWFVSVDIAAPVGMKRFCNRAVNVTDNIDGSSQTWTCGVGLEVGNIDQGREFVLNPSTMSVDNINNTWGNWANSPGLRDVPVEIYVVWYDAAGAMTGAVKMWSGRIDEQRHLQRSEFGLKPWRAQWARRVLTAIPGQSPLLPAPFMPADGTKFN
jgi:hypothetical protein